MQCLILAGGLGTRMQSVGGGTPKALLPAGFQTFIDLQLQWLKFLGVGEVVLALAHEGRIIEDHVEKRKDALDFPKIKYSFDGPKLLGTGGAIKKAQSLLEKDFLVIYGDSFLFIDLHHFKSQHLEGAKPLTLSIFKNDNEGDKSNVIFRDGQLIKYDKNHRTKEMKYIDYGLSFVNLDFFLKNSPKENFDFSDFITETCEKKMAQGYEAKVMFQEIGSPDGYSRFLKLLEQNKFELKGLRLLMK